MADSAYQRVGRGDRSRPTLPAVTIGPCRWCGRLSYLLDTDGQPAHPCCAKWIGTEHYARCHACDASEAHARGQRGTRSTPRRPRRVTDTKPL